jgi:hypothetical protein
MVAASHPAASPTCPASRSTTISSETTPSPAATVAGLLCVLHAPTVSRPFGVL